MKLLAMGFVSAGPAGAAKFLWLRVVLTVAIF